MTPARPRMAIALLAAVLLGGCGAGGPAVRSGPPVRTIVGAGPAEATIYRPAGRRGPLPTVIFIHGWSMIAPGGYLPWIRHLVARGNAVIYPRYQGSPLSLPSLSLARVVRAVRASLARSPVLAGSLVVAGHSAGGALAADYAALASRDRLPVPRGIFAADPARRLHGQPFGLPPADLSRIAPRTRILALAGARDPIAGTTFARDLIRETRRVPRALKRFLLVSDPRAADHFAPQRATPAVRRDYWSRLDLLIQAARRPTPRARALARR